MNKVWLITGASRGIGLAIARVALNAGESVAATARDAGTVTKALGEHQNLLAVGLDLTVPRQAEMTVKAATERFGRIDILVNNAGYGQLGMFEENPPEAVQQQFYVNVFGTFDVTRAVLPGMRAQRAGHIFTITSIGGLRGGAGGSLYCSTKFALEGWSESLAHEVEPFGIHVTAVEPGFFRTDFLDSSSVRYGNILIDDYREASSKLRSFYDERSRQQVGDPVKLAEAMLQLTDEKKPPLHFLAGTDAVRVLESRIERDRQEMNQWRELSSSTDYPA